MAGLDRLDPRAGTSAVADPLGTTAVDAREEALFAQFRHEQHALIRNRLFVTAVLGLILLCGVLASDWISGAETFGAMLELRLATVAVFVLVAVFHFTGMSLRIVVPLRFLMILATEIHLLAAVVVAGSVTSPVFGWLGLSVLCLSLVLYLGLWESLLLSGLVMGGALLVVGFLVPDMWLAALYPLVQLAGASLFAVVVCFLAERLRWREFQTRLALAEERKKTEGLLLNILPASVAERLKQGVQTLADGHEEVTVLFADICGFTPWASSRTPEEVVAFLNGLFSDFDQMTLEAGLEKVKTVGDAYMVVGGLPHYREDHARAIARLALAMLAHVETVEACREGGLSLRIGIHTGPVVAGVIGTSKYSYDLWGDTVNTSSRMQSHAPSGTIQVTRETWALLKDHFALESRGTIEVKGKGQIPTWLLRGPAA